MIPAELVAALERPDLREFAARGKESDSLAAAARTYLADGRGVAWQVATPEGWRTAVDAELTDRRLPDMVRARSGLADGVSAEGELEAWTQAEVMAKLTDTPILLRIREFGLGLADLPEHEPIALVSHATDRFVVTVGACRLPADRSR